MDVKGLQAGSHNTQINHYAAAPPPLAWPLLVGRAPLRADAFQSRGSLVAVASPVLVGDGGTGKTQLAAALFEQARADGTDLAVWVTASSRTAALTGYADAAGALRLATGDVERAAAAFLTWLANTDRTWIVVLDDVADPADLRGLWPSGPTGRLVLTTRRRDAALRSRGTVIDVDVFTPAESAAYLTAKLDRDDPDAAALAADLGHLPLALAQAAALIVDDALTCAEYRSLFADRTSRLADLFPNATGDDHDHELAATWSLAADRADALAPVGLARPMLLLAATLDPNGIPESVLTSTAACTYLGGTAQDARKTLRNLHRLSLISHNATDPLRSVRMHALAQRSAIESAPGEDLRGVQRVGADALLEAWEAAGQSTSITARFVANGRVWADRLDSPDAAMFLHPFVTRVGESAGEIGLPEIAQAYFSEIAGIVGQLWGDSHRGTLALRYRIGYWQGERGDFPGAVSLLEQVLADQTRILGTAHPDTLRTRGNLAYWRGHAGDPARAARETSEVLSILVRTPDIEASTVLSTRHNLAHWRGLAGDPRAAAEESARLLVDAERVLGPDHPDTLDTRRNLAHWRGLAGDPGAAVEGLDAVLADYVRVLGADHPDTMQVRENLVHWRPQDLDALLADRTRVLGADHPHTVRTRRIRQ
ncbi:tetratricopeptide repeat protein [Dactylosporangium sp. NPDC006015]|uniref:tetratricopeptide repeat protein n=1 Tax=Dactylosporangium sp. NPDC006015 TaxID=3154576 RepID=UPI0033A97BFD